MMPQRIVHIGSYYREPFVMISLWRQICVQIMITVRCMQLPCAAAQALGLKLLDSAATTTVGVKQQC